MEVEDTVRRGQSPGRLQDLLCRCHPSGGGSDSAVLRGQPHQDELFRHRLRRADRRHCQPCGPEKRQGICRPGRQAQHYEDLQRSQARNDEGLDSEPRRDGRGGPDRSRFGQGDFRSRQGLYRMHPQVGPFDHQGPHLHL